MVNALDSLVLLQAGMPQWLEKAETLRNTAYTRYNEFTKLSESLDKPPALGKTKGSTESLRPQDDGEKVPSVGETPEIPSAVPFSASLQAVQSTVPTAAPNGGGKINIDPRNRHLFREVREQRRKRKNPSVIEGQPSPQRSRPRLSLVIYYDSSIQEGFEHLVRNISGARSVLRKARTAVSLRPKWSSMKPEQSPFGRQGAYAYHMPTMPRIGQVNGNILSESKNGLEVYDQLDRELEAAQTLCEVGAHQALRDGDCFEELVDVKLHFSTCAKLIDDEVEELKLQNQHSNAARDNIDVEAMLEKEAASHSEPSVFHSRDPAAIPVDGPIEVDHEDHASIIVDLSEIPGRHQYSSKHQQLSRTSSSSGGTNTQPISATETAWSGNALAAPLTVDIEDTNLKYTLAGEHVPLEHATAMAAASIAVGEVPLDAPDLDLSEMRKVIPRRRPEQAPSPAPSPTPPAPTTEEEPTFDFAAMRKMATKRRGPPGPRVETTSNPAPVRPAVDSSGMPNIAIDSSFTGDQKSGSEKDLLAVDAAPSLQMSRPQVSA